MPGVRGLGRVPTSTSTELVDRERRSTRARSPSPTSPSTPGTGRSSPTPASSTRTSSCKDYTAAAVGGLPPQAGHQDQGSSNINITYEGLVVKVQRLFLAKDRESMQPHIRAFVDRAVTFADLPRLRRHPAQRRPRCPPRSTGATSPSARPCRSATWPSSSAASTTRRCAPLVATLRDTLDSLVEIGLGYLSLDRESGTLSGRRGPAGEDGPPPRLQPDRRHVRLRRAHRRAAPARHPADERPAAPPARQGQHRAGGGAQARDDRDRRPRGRPRARAPAGRRADLLQRRRGRAAPLRHPDRHATSTTGRRCATEVRTPTGQLSDPRRQPAQPARTSTSTSRSGC